MVEILPSLTNQIAIDVFKYLIDAELRKHMPQSYEFRFGCQEGLIAALSMLFGYTDDETAEQVYDAGESWLQITQQIVKDNLSSWIADFDALKDVDYVKMEKDIDSAIEKFVLKNPTLLIKSLSNL